MWMHSQVADGFFFIRTITSSMVVKMRILWFIALKSRALDKCIKTTFPWSCTYYICKLTQGDLSDYNSEHVTCWTWQWCMQNIDNYLAQCKICCAMKQVNLKMEYTCWIRKQKSCASIYSWKTTVTNISKQDCITLGND